MALIKVDNTPVTMTKSFVRRVEERTCKIEIFTPKTDAGIAGYSAVVYREWIEYHDDTVVDVRKLPPLTIPIEGSILPIVGIISNAIDTAAAQGVAELRWPLDKDGNLLTP